jgi:hypothetical protein
MFMTLMSHKRGMPMNALNQELRRLDGRAQIMHWMIEALEVVDQTPFAEDARNIQSFIDDSNAFLDQCPI